MNFKDDLIILIIILSAALLVTVLFLVVTIVVKRKEDKGSKQETGGDNEDVILDAVPVAEDEVIDAVPLSGDRKEITKYADNLPPAVAAATEGFSNREKAELLHVIMDGPKTRIMLPLSSYRYPMDFIYDFFSSVGMYIPLLSVPVIEKLYYYGSSKAKDSRELVFYNYAIIDTYTANEKLGDYGQKLINKCLETYNIETNILNLRNCYVQSVVILVDYFYDQKDFKKALYYADSARKRGFRDAKGGNFDEITDYLRGNF